MPNTNNENTSQGGNPSDPVTPPNVSKDLGTGSGDNKAQANTSQGQSTVQPQSVSPKQPQDNAGQDTQTGGGQTQAGAAASGSPFSQPGQSSPKDMQKEDSDVKPIGGVTQQPNVADVSNQVTPSAKQPGSISPSIPSTTPAQVQTGQGVQKSNMNKKSTTPNVSPATPAQSSKEPLKAAGTASPSTPTGVKSGVGTQSSSIGTSGASTEPSQSVQQASVQPGTTPKSQMQTGESGVSEASDSESKQDAKPVEPPAQEVGTDSGLASSPSADAPSMPKPAVNTQEPPKKEVGTSAIPPVKQSAKPGDGQMQPMPQAQDAKTEASPDDLKPKSENNNQQVPPTP